jgi:hypothetical protein
MRERFRLAWTALVIGAVVPAAAGCGLQTTETVDIVGFTSAHGEACTSLVVISGTDGEYVREGDETESSLDCESPPPDRTPVDRNRRSLVDPDPERDWDQPQLLTATDAHGRACTLVAMVLASGQVDETTIDCDYPPEGRTPGPASRGLPPDPDPESDPDRVSVATFADGHGRACTTSTATGGIGVEIALSCEYDDGEAARTEPSETVMPR